jgi:hypothetical protein
LKRKVRERERERDGRGGGRGGLDERTRASKGAVSGDKREEREREIVHLERRAR